MALFARSLASIPEPDARKEWASDALHRFLEVGFRLYLVRLMLPDDQRKPVSEWLTDDAPQIPTAGQAKGDFLAFLDTLGPCYPDYESLAREGAPLREAFVEQAATFFDQGFAELGGYLPWIMKAVGKVHQRYRKITVLPRTQEEADRVIRTIQESLSAGRPVLRHRLIENAIPDGHANGELGEEQVDPYMDSLHLVSVYLREYITTIGAGAGKRMILCRGKHGVGVEYPAGDRPWYEFQVDQGVAQMFCPVPRSRQLRTAKRITMRKAMRDIAASLQGRRLYRLIHDTLRSE